MSEGKLFFNVSWKLFFARMRPTIVCLIIGFILGCVGGYVFEMHHVLNEYEIFKGSRLLNAYTFVFGDNSIWLAYFLSGICGALVLECVCFPFLIHKMTKIKVDET